MGPLTAEAQAEKEVKDMAMEVVVETEEEKSGNYTQPQETECVIVTELKGHTETVEFT